jgi:hypothetical protein
MFRRALLTVSFALLSAAACTKKDKDQGPPSTGSATTGSAAVGSGSTMAGSDTGSAAGSDTGSGSTDSAAGSGAGSATADAETEFDKLSHEDKVKFMKTKVMPPMKAAFQKFDPKEFANFTCKTCHGKDPQKSKHEMPNPELPKLDFEALKRGEDKDWVEFMSDVVKPEMAKILGEHEMTQEEPTGFGCLACHTQKK